MFASWAQPVDPTTATGLLRKRRMTSDTFICKKHMAQRGLNTILMWHGCSLINDDSNSVAMLGIKFYLRNADYLEQCLNLSAFCIKFVDHPTDCNLFKKYNLIKFAIVRPLTLNYNKNVWNHRGAPDEATCLTVFLVSRRLDINLHKIV